MRRHLADDLGIDPGPGLARMQERVLQQDPTLAPPAAPRPAGQLLPVPFDSFLGRDDDVRAVAKLLEAARIVTLTGAGGSGKTRLALEVAASRDPAAVGEVFFVDAS